MGSRTSVDHCYPKPSVIRTQLYTIRKLSFPYKFSMLSDSCQRLNIFQPQPPSSEALGTCPQNLGARGHRVRTSQIKDEQIPLLDLELKKNLFRLSTMFGQPDAGKRLIYVVIRCIIATALHYLRLWCSLTNPRGSPISY